MILDRTLIIIPVNCILSLGSVPLANLHGAPLLPCCPNKLEFMVELPHINHTTQFSNNDCYLCIHRSRMISMDVC